MAKRKYDESYIKFGFTSLNDHGTEKGQCVVCYCVLSNESLRPSNHLEKKHPELKNKSEEYFKRLESSCKRQQLDVTGSFNKVIGNLRKHPLLLAK